MKLAVVSLSLVMVCQHLAADALTYKEPRKDQSNVLLGALTKLQALELPRLHSCVSDPETTYYLRDASFLGRTNTTQGFKNLIRVTFIRSSPYSEDRGLTPPPRGHSFVVIFDDDLEPQYFLPIPMPDSAVLQDTVLAVDEDLYGLTVDATFNAFTKIKSEQGGAAQPANAPEAFRTLVQNPPSISEGLVDRESFTVGDASAIIEGKEFVAHIAFSTVAGADDSASSYHFRSYSKTHHLEVRGSGKVFERYFRIQDPNDDENRSEVIDRGSELVIDAGLFKIEWSAGNHLYFDGKKYTVKLGTYPEYEALTKQSEQGGADQPATRSESNSQDGDKARPESEGRSR